MKTGLRSHAFRLGILLGCTCLLLPPLCAEPTPRQEKAAFFELLDLANPSHTNWNKPLLAVGAQVTNAAAQTSGDSALALYASALSNLLANLPAHPYSCGPSRVPGDPQAFASNFVAWLDLDAPGLEAVQAHAQASEFQAALAAWRDYKVTRLRQRGIHELYQQSYKSSGSLQNLAGFLLGEKTEAQYLHEATNTYGSVPFIDLYGIAGPPGSIGPISWTNQPPLEDKALETLFGYNSMTFPSPLLYRYWRGASLASGEALTLTCADTLVTARTAQPHGLTNNEYVTVYAATPTSYNGLFPVTVINPTTVTYTAQSAPSASPATGSGRTLARSRESRILRKWFEILHDYSSRNKNMVSTLQLVENKALQPVYWMIYEKQDWGIRAGPVLGQSGRMSELLAAIALFAKLLPEAVPAQRDWFSGINAPLDTALAPGALELVPQESLARIALSLMADTAEALVFAYYRVGMTPNQRLSGLTSLYLLPKVLDEFRAAPELSRQTDDAMADYARNMFYPDGPMLERSPNYNEGDADKILTLEQMAEGEVTPGLASLIASLVPYQRAFAHMQTPMGYLPRMASYCAPNPPALWQEDETSLAAWRAAFRASVSDAVRDRTAADLYLGLLDSGSPVPRVTSLALPYAGYFIQRNGWSRKAHFLYFANTPPGNGHNQKDQNGIQVCAFGRSLLTTAGPPPYNVTFTDPGQADDYAGFAAFQGEGSSFKVNTVAVDGRSQNNGFTYNPTVTNVTRDCLWHTSDTFDYVEGTYDGGYGNGKWTGYYDAFTNGNQAVSTVTHRRGVTFLRHPGIWIVADVISARDALSHQSRQIWNFPAQSGSPVPICGFAPHEVVANLAAQRISTTDADGPNVHLYHLGPQPVTYETYAGSRAPYLGWFGTGIGGLRHPAANVHAVWQGVGTQLVVTVIAPSDTGAPSPVLAIRTNAATASAIDLELDLENGHTLRIAQGLRPQTLTIGSRTFAAQALVADREPGGVCRGVALSAEGFADPHFTFTASNADFTVESPVRRPSDFAWADNGEWVQPSTASEHNTAPQIDPVPPQRIPRDTDPVWIAFTVHDAESQSSNLLVSAHSLDPALLPDDRIVLAGEGRDRMIRVQPTAGRFGTTSVELTVTDPQGLSLTVPFTLNVYATLYWDTSDGEGLQGGAGAWDTAHTNWSDSASGSPVRSAWSGSGNDAVFADADASATVTAGTTQIVNDLFFTAPGHILPGGALHHPYGPFTVRADADARIAAPLSAAGDLIKEGTASLTLEAVCDFSGETRVQGGTLCLAADQALPPARGITLCDGTAVGHLTLDGASQTASHLILAGSADGLTNRVTIASGRTLTINGPLLAGGTPAGITNVTAVTGEGTLAVTREDGLIQIGMVTNVSNSNRATLDLSGLRAFVADLGTGGVVRVGENFNDRGGHPSVLLLAATNTITAGTLGVGEGGRGSQQVLNFGRGSNTLHVDTLLLGTGMRDSAAVTFATPTGTLTVRGADGAGRAALNLGTGGSTSGSGANNLLDLRGHLCDLLLSTVTIGEQLRIGSPTHTLHFNSGLLDAERLVMARTSGAGTSTSSFILGGGTVNIGSDGILLASNAVGVLTLTGGTLFTDGDILKGPGGTGTATLTLNGTGAVIDLNRRALGSAAAPVSAHLLAGTVRNLGEYNGGADFVKRSDTVLVLDGTNTYSGRTLVSNGTLRVTGALANANAVDVAGPATLDLTGSLTADTVLIRTNAHLLCCGTLSGALLVEPGGSVDSGCGGESILNGAVTNYGVITATGGTRLRFTQRVVNHGLIDLRAGSAHFFEGVTGTGTVLGNYESDTTSRGTPFSWLTGNGLVSGDDYETADLADTDSDGVANWREYQAGTDPRAAFSRPVFNTVPYAESFENLAGWGGVYTRVFPFMGWFSSLPGEDRSQLVRQDYTFEKARPLPSSTHTNVLRLDTARAVLTNSFGAGFDMGRALTRIDMLMKIRPSARTPDELPSFDAGIKSAVYADENGYLTVYHGVAAPDGSLQSNTVSVTGFRIDSNLWHRLAFTVDATVTNVALFAVRIDGVTVTNRNAYPAEWKTRFLTTGNLPPTGAGGSWFRLATTNLRARLLTGIAFSGSGYVDDLVVQEEPTHIVLSVTRTGTGLSSLGTAPFTAVDFPVGAETQIVYTAGDWHRIAALEANGDAVPDAPGARVFTQRFVNVMENVSNAVSFAEALPSETGYAPVPTGWLRQWDENAVRAGDCDPFDVPSEYLLGLSPVSSNTFRFAIEGVTLSGSQIVTVVRRSVTGELAPDGMHGTLVLQSTGSLGTAFTNIAATAVTGGAAFDAQGRRAYTNTVHDASRFYRAVIE
ncbi:MAG: autotransporter-associated beta strand repeat-containing protein [Kiritimatiellia bacterium]|jgi:autotransporter-associated beta strand protein|nr:autotransporter-associated beta strand repeat-containing protein [Kiritimatiellia bacterium]